MNRNTSVFIGLKPIRIDDSADRVFIYEEAIWSFIGELMVVSMFPPMSGENTSDITQVLQAIKRGDGQASEELLPLVYGELRRLAAARMAQEAPGQTLQATALVHEAWLRMVDAGDRTWENRAHFFGAAAEAMRRILIENARRKSRLKRGGGRIADGH